MCMVFFFADNYPVFYHIYTGSSSYYNILDMKAFCKYSVNGLCLIFGEENLKRTSQKIPKYFQISYEENFKNKQEIGKHRRSEFQSS